LDNVLDPNDAKVLQEKVSQGRLARGMIDRIQSVLARSKLAAPKIDARGTAGDANVVAEYLDNTLPSQHVVDFEQACLGEDARLAEVAGCHQILTIVLAKPAVISPSLRHRIRQLGSSVQAPPIELDGSETYEASKPIDGNGSIVVGNGKNFRIDSAHRSSGSGPVETGLEMSRPIATEGLELSDQLISHVPEYLKGGTKGDWTNPLSIIGLVAALLFVAWLSLGSFDDVQSLLHKTTIVDSNPSNAMFPIQPAQKMNDTVIDGAPVIQSEAPPTAPPIAASTATIAGASETPPSIEPSDSTPPVMSIENAAPPVPTEAKAGKGETPEPETSIGEVPSPPLSSTIAPDATLKNGIEWQPETKISSNTPVFASREIKNGPREVRQLIIGESLALNEKLIVPAAFRTEFKIAPGIRWQVADETVLSAKSLEESDTCAVNLQLGRAMVYATPDCQRLFLETPGHAISLDMKDASTVVAIELRYKRMIGRTIEEEAASKSETPSGLMQPCLSIVCAVGEVAVSLPNGEPLKLEVNQGVECVPDTPTKLLTVTESPWWYRASVQRPIDVDAADDLSEQFAKESKAESIVQQLTKIAQGRRSETAALAIRTLFMLGEYSQLVGTNGILSNPASRPHRAVILESLFQSLGTDIANLSLMKIAIEAADPPRASRLLALLYLPNNAQLADGADRGLVESLSSPFPDERVLGIFELNAIVGKEHGFQSDRRPSLESVQPWKQLLTSGKIRWQK